MGPRFEARAKKFFNFGWEHGIYGDYWSFVHILTGLILGIGASYLALPFWMTFWTVFVALVAYEAWELFAGIVEDFENALTDIVIGQIGFVVGFLVIEHHFAPSEYTLYVLGEAVILALLLLSIGYRKFLKRKMREARNLRRRARGKSVV